MPRKNGEIMAASAVVPAASPICSPEKCSVSPSHVPIVTYHAPQTKYCRNIIADNFARVDTVIVYVPSALSPQPSALSPQPFVIHLGPPRFDRRLGQDHAREHVDGGAQALVDRRERVLVLDAHHVVVPGEPQRADDALPFELVVPPADAAEQPRPLRHAAIRFRVDDAV